MGLDMYLTKKTFIGNQYEHREPVEISIPSLHHIQPKRISYIEEAVGYWRKANAIHGWFVNHVQEGKDDCEQYYVSKQNLRDLRTVCQSVLDDPKLAPTLLPVQSGFFFGSTDYDEWYITNLNTTIEILDAVLAEGEGDIYYRASW